MLNSWIMYQLVTVGRCNEYRPKGGDAPWLGVKAYMVLFAGNTVWSISERFRGVCVDALYKSTYTYYTLLRHSAQVDNIMAEVLIWLMSHYHLRPPNLTAHVLIWTSGA